MYWMRSLKYTIGISYLVLVIITIAISVFAAINFTNLGASIGHMLRENYQSTLAAENMVKAIERQENAQLAMLARQVGDIEVTRKDFMNSGDQFYKWYEQAYSSIAHPEEPPLLDSIFIAYSAYSVASDSLRKMVQAHTGQNASLYHTQIVVPLATRLRAHSFRLLEINQTGMLRTEKRINEFAATATNLVIGASVLAIVLSLIASIRFARGIVKPIIRLTRTVRQIGKGHLNLKIEVTTEDEIAELSHEFNKMTERLQAFEAMNVQQLIDEKKKSESLVAAIPNPVIVTDAVGRVLLLNEAAMDLLHITDNEWQGQYLSEVVNEPQMVNKIGDLAYIDDEMQSIIEYRAAGEPRYYRPRQTLIRDFRGQLSLVITLLEDVTMFKEVEQLKSDFLHAVSHELRTPLTSLGMALDILQQQVVGTVNNAQNELLETAKEDTVRLKRLVKGLLDLARLESASSKPIHEIVRFPDVVEEALGPLRLPFREHNVDLQVRLDQNIQEFYGDGQQLGWVMTNLVGNALRYTPENGCVRVEATQKDGSLHVCVSDSGRGISKEALETIFEKFVQVKSAEEATPGSVGLGLAIAKKVVETHGGRIWAESDPGKGSQFRFVLPVAAVH